MPAWKNLRTAQPDQEYLALLTCLPAQEISDDPSVFRLREASGGSAGRNEGIVGYSLRAKFMRLSFWTLSVWESEEALQAFLHEGFHAGVMSVLMPDMAATNFVRWKIKGSACPPSWEEALKR